MAATNAPRARDLVGQAIGGYRIVAPIGKGGMGEVYLGVHPTLGKRVAIKVLRAEIAGDDDMRRRFFDEARAAAALESPHIVDILDLAQLPDGQSYMTMEFLEGESLAQHLGRVGKLPAAVAVAVAAQALDGLAAAHAEGIVHRDLKPANLFLARTRRGSTVKVLDFGLAKLMGRLPAGGATQSGTILGTPEYMAPEQASTSSRQVDARADVYAFGALLYEMVVGRPPFQSDNWGQLLVKHQSEAPPPLDGVPPALAAVITRALEKQPESRFAGAEPLRQALLEAMGGAAALPPLPEPALAIDPAALGAPRPSSRLRAPGPDVSPAVSSTALPFAPTRRSRRGLPVLPLAAGAAAVLVAAVALLLMARRHAPRSPLARPATAERRPRTAPIPLVLPPPASTQRCTFTLTDEAGHEHRFGGPRTRQAAASPNEANIWATGSSEQGLTIGCTPAYGESGLIFLTVRLPPGAGQGTHTLAAADAVSVSFNATLPDGFSQKSYSGSGSLQLEAVGAGPGSWLRGSFSAKPAFAGKNIAISGRFDFKL